MNNIPEVESAWLLAKAWARNDTDPSSLELVEFIEHVSRLASYCSCSYGLLLQVSLSILVPPSAGRMLHSPLVPLRAGHGLPAGCMELPFPS